MRGDLAFKGRTVGELMALLAQLPADMPVRVQCGESEPYPFSLHVDRLDGEDGWDGDPCDVLQLDVTG